MPDLYLYISTQKVAQLNEQSPSLFQGIAGKLDFKFPFVSGGISGQTQSSTLTNLKRVVPKIEKQFEIPDADAVHSLSAAPVFFRFKGAAAKQVQDSQFWIALESESSAVLLAGSASNALGGSSVGANISPSADPMGAVRALIERTTSTDKVNERALDPTFALSYIWQCLMVPGYEHPIMLPKVEGIAVFCGLLPVSPDQMGRVGKSNLKTMLVGSPIFVRQVQ